MAQSQPFLGRIISHYRILEKIGAGGMGEVYRAHDQELDRHVALKILPLGMIADEVARKRFRQEALALAKLNHPNIETIFQFSSQDDVDFLVMELIPGRPLSEKIKEGALNEKEVLRLGMQFAAGLSAAHAAGIIHRDLKPANLFVTPGGHLKILDFGLAKLLRLELDEDLTRSVATEAGKLMGTVPYMAPEQLRGLPVDARSDIYAAGAVLYEMAAGRRPFPQAQNAELVGAILHKSPDPPSSLNPGISPGLEHVISMALEKDPTQRYQSARELHVALESISSSGKPVSSRQDALSAGPSVRSRAAVYVASALVVIVLVASLVLATNLGRFRDRLFNSSPPRGSSAVLFPSVPIRARSSVAVLGFKNISGQPDKAWISTALAEMLTTELAAGEQLRTIPGENIAQMKINLSLADAESYGQQTLEKIHANLNADDVVIGSYFPIGDGGIRLDMRLQDAVRGVTIATVSEKGTESQIDDLISRAGAELREKLGIGAITQAQAAAVKAAQPSNPDAARLYASGLEKLRLFEASASVELFQKAIVAAPDFGLAHSALASAWSVLGYDANAQLEAKKAYDLSVNLPREQRLSIEGRYRESTFDWAKAIEVYKTLRDFFPDNLDYGLQLAAAQTAAGQGSAAVATAEELRKLPSPAGNDPRISLAEANAQNTLGDFKRAQAAAQLAVTQGQSTGTRLLVAHALLTQGSALRDLGKTKEALQAAEEARQLFAAAGDQGGVTSALINRGTLLYRMGDMAAAKRTWEESLAFSRDIGHKTDIQTCLNNLANVHWRTGDFTGAKTLLDQSLAMANKLGNPRKAAQATTNLAGVLYDQGDLSGAARKEQSALEIFRRIGDRSGVATALSNLGMIQADQEDFNDARAKFGEAQSVFRELGEQSGVASVTSKLANILYLQSEALKAKSMYEQSLAAYTAIGDKGGMLMAQGSLGNVFYDLGDLPQAREMYEQSIALARASQNKSSLALGLRSLGDVLLAQADFDGSKQVYDEALAVRKVIGEEGGVLDCRLALAALSIEEGHLASAESSAREIANEYRKQKSPLNEAGALSTLAYALLRQAKTHQAGTAIDRAARLAAKSQQSELRTPVLIMADRIHGIARESAASTQDLETILNEATALGNIPSQYQACLALGEIDWKWGNTTSGRARLSALQRDAAAKGFLLIARKAAAVAGLPPLPNPRLQR